jgi:serine/threonine protein phosphatase 1
MLDIISRLFSKDAKNPPSRIDRLTYAIGDIHGKVGLLENMLTSIKTDAAAFDTKPMLVFLGDYVDRGNASNLVLDTLLEVQSSQWCDSIFLKGNHEEAMINFLEKSSYGPRWIEHGGDATLVAYGVALPRKGSGLKGWEGTRKALINALPDQHSEFFRQMSVTYISGDYLFVHAGVKPGQPLALQDERIFLWIRNEFLESKKASDYVVVHGHTPEPEVANLRWRIGLDTGAYASGILSAIRLHETSRQVLQVRAHS